ncbi:MAG: EamA family transporter [Bacillota bacterium]|nr:MAG: hypothetical protein DIU70_03690 [Bacillota bacterium]
MAGWTGTAAIGALCAVLAAFSFALWNLYLQRGLERGGTGPAALLALTLAISGSFLPVVAAAGARGALPPLDPRGLGWFALAGLMTGAVGPVLATHATRSIGAARTTAIRLLDPFFALCISVLFLGERLRAGALAGIGLIALALGLLQRDGQEGGTPGRGMSVGTALAVAASLAFTLGSVARKAGLSLLPSAWVAGALEGLTGLAAVLVSLTAGRRWSEGRAAFSRACLDLWWSGLAAAAGTLFLNLALQRVPVPVAVALRNTSPWFALVLVPRLLGGTHRPGRWMWVSTGLLTAGMVLILAA